MEGGENSVFPPSKGILHQQHLPDIVCLVPICVNPSVALGAFCDWTSLNWNTVNRLSIELIQLYAIVKKQDSPQLFEFCSR